MPLICRHNRFTAECPICSKGTALEQGGGAATRAPSSRASGGRKRAAAVAAPTVKGPYGVAGPYEGDDGGYEVRLERVPGGLRLAVWAAGRIQRRAPALEAADLPGLLSSAAERGALSEEEAQEMLASLGDATEQGEDTFGRSPGPTGELRDELRVERLEGGRVRIARWIERPGRGWELQETPVMLPAARYAEALASAAERGALCR